MTDDIKLPPLPRLQVPLIEADVSLLDIKVLAQWCERTATDYALAAVFADRERRAPAEGPAGEREAFEAWADENGFCLDCKFFEEGNNYTDPDTHLAYEIWQEAWQSRAAQQQPAEIEALRAEVERLNQILGRIVEGDGDSTLTIRAGADAFAAAREYLRPNTVEQFIEPQED